MRFIHTADWHLGRIFHGVYLTEDQDYVLSQLLDILPSCKIDVLLISGDIYDRAVPPPEAVKLLDRVLSLLILELKIPVIIISGNHDSPERLGFASHLLAGQKLYLSGVITPEIIPVILKDPHGPVHFYPVPYGEPVVVKEKLEDENIKDHSSAMRALIGKINKTDCRSVLLSHSFVTGGQVSDSERPIFAGRASTVDTDVFEGFNYVALGHLHRPQQIGDLPLYYSGSLMKYSFSEVNHKPGVNLVEIDKHGKCKVEKIQLIQKRDLRSIEGHLETLLKNPPEEERRYDYFKIKVLDKEPVLDVMGKLRGVYPNVLHVERLFTELERRDTEGIKDFRRLTDEELFSSFYREVTGEEMTEEERETYINTVNMIRREEREVII